MRCGVPHPNLGPRSWARFFCMRALFFENKNAPSVVADETLSFVGHMLAGGAATVAVCAPRFVAQETIDSLQRADAGVLYACCSPAHTTLLPAAHFRPHAAPPTLLR